MKESIRLHVAVKIVLLLYFLSPISIPSSMCVSNVESDEHAYLYAGNVTTVWQEYSFIDPAIVETSTEFIYITTWGNYSIPKLSPYLMSYVYINETKLIDNSVFWINCSQILLPYDPIVLTARENCFEQRVRVLPASSSETVGYMTTKIDFFRERPPKISVYFEKTAKWNSGSFNLFWALTSPYTQCTHADTTMSCNMDLRKFGDFMKAELQQSVDDEISNLKLLVDWTDAGKSSCYVGKLDIPSILKDKGMLVLFPSNISYIDPTTVGTTHTSYCTLHNHQRKTFFAGGYHYVFYCDHLNRIVYNTMASNETWHQPIPVKSGGIIEAHQFSVWWDGNYVHYTFASNQWGRELYYRRGILNVSDNNRSVIWELERTAVTPSDETLLFYPYVCVDSNGYPWIGFCNWTSMDSYDRKYPFAIKANSKDGSSWGLLTQLSNTTGYTYVNILPLTNGNLYALYGATGSRIKGRFRNSTSFADEEFVTTSSMNSLLYSAVAQGEEVHVIFGMGSSSLKYVRRSSTGWEAEVAVQSGSASYPCVSIDPLNGDLCAFWFHSDTLYMKKCVNGMWDTQASTPLGTEFTAPSSMNLVCYYQVWGRRIGVVWREGNASPYSVRYGYLTKSINIKGQDWYYWNTGKDRAVIVLFGGFTIPFPMYGGGVGINDLFDNSRDPTHADYYVEYTTDKHNFIDELVSHGFDVLSNKGETYYYAKNHVFTQLIHNATVWLEEQGYNHVFLFGFSAGGIAVAYEIQKDYAATSFDAALMASAVVDYDPWNMMLLYQSAHNASKVKVSTSFISNINDTGWYGSLWYQMRSYYENMTHEKEWFNWTEGLNGPHDPFPDPSLDDPDIKVLDVAVNLYRRNILYSLTVRTYTTAGSAISDVLVWIDDDSSRPSPVTVTLTEGDHTVEVPSVFYQTGPDPGTQWKYTFQYWENSSTDNPRSLFLGENTTIMAYYKKTLVHWGPLGQKP